MYKSLKEIIHGWTKNLFFLIGNDLKSLFQHVFSLLFFSLLPFILLIYSLSLVFLKGGFTNGLCLISTLGLVAFIVFTQWRKFNELSYPNVSAFLYPVGVGTSIILFLLSAYKGEIRREIKWKGRRYSV
jgi:hypothetical protein